MIKNRMSRKFLLTAFSCGHPRRIANRYSFHRDALALKDEVKMTTDDAYMNFLDKANHHFDNGSVEDQQSQNKRFELRFQSESVDVPLALQRASEMKYYVSDADEPFVPVALKLDDGLPDEESFATLVNHPEPLDAKVRILAVDEWDPHGQYRELVDAVRETVNNKSVRIYRIVLEGPKIEYWLVGLKDQILLGVKALAIET